MLPQPSGQRTGGFGHPLLGYMLGELPRFNQLVGITVLCMDYASFLRMGEWHGPFPLAHPGLDASKHSSQGGRRA